MAQYLVSFDDGAMDHVADDLAEVGRAAQAVAREARAAGVWLYSAGVARQRASVVAIDGTVSDGPFPESKAVLGGFAVLETATRGEAEAWAARIASACRCPQEVRELGPDPTA